MGFGRLRYNLNPLPIQGMSDDIIRLSDSPITTLLSRPSASDIIRVSDSAVGSIVSNPGEFSFPNQPEGWSILTDYDFTDTVPVTDGYLQIGSSGWWTNNPEGNASRDTSISGATNGAAFRNRYPEGTCCGIGPGGSANHHPGAESSRFYLAFRIRHSSNFVFHGASNKTWILSTSSFSGFGHFQTVSGHLFLNLAGGSGIGHNLVSDSEEIALWRDGTRSDWVWVELFYDYTNSIVSWWINEVPVAHHTSTPFMQPNVDGWGFDPTYGGTGGNVPEEQYRWLDRTRIVLP